MKRIIFTLLYENGQFIQSRNFRRQRVGDINWILNNYDFPRVSLYLDELMVINISSNDFDQSHFFDAVLKITQRCFIPLTIGGNINSMDDAKRCYDQGADKIFINTILSERPSEVTNIANYYGSQAIVAGVNYSIFENKYYFASSGGRVDDSVDIKQHCEDLIATGVGEVVFQGIHRDGTGFGIDHKIFDLLPQNFSMPVILMGGVGNANHIIETLKHSCVDGVSTANLLNFIGDGFIKARNNALSEGVNIPSFNMDAIL